MNIVIVGGGKQVDFLVLSLLKKNKKHNLTIINESERDCKDMARSFNIQGYDVQVVNGEGSKPFILEDAGIKDADLIISLTSKDADNLIICQLAKLIFGVKRAFATVCNPENVDVFNKLGINTAVSSTRTMANIIEQMAEIDEVAHYLPLEDGKVLLLTLTISNTHPVCGELISDLNLYSLGSNLGCIIRNGNVIIPTRLPTEDVKNTANNFNAVSELHGELEANAPSEHTQDYNVIKNNQSNQNLEVDGITEDEILEIENSYNNIGDIDISSEIDLVDNEIINSQNDNKIDFKKDNRIQEGDKLMIITSPESKKEILNKLLGE